MKRDSVGHTFLVAFLVCAVCSIFVSVAAVGLRDRQNKNRERDRKKNILIAAGLYDEKTRKLSIDGVTIEDLFTEVKGERPWVEAKIVSLKTGEPIDKTTETRIIERFGSIDKYDQKKAARDLTGDWSEPVESAKDVAGIKRREHFSTIYFVYLADGKLDQVILPIRGYGLWSTLWGFIALDADLRTIRGITFYEHGETPGLGGEVDNPRWKAQWRGKKAFGEKPQTVEIRVIKGQVRPNTSGAEHKVDGLSGATITSRGVSNMLTYWLGESGFGPLIERLQKERK